MSRLDNTIRNIKVGYIAQIFSMLMGFLSRTVFIYALDMNFLGVSGLFTNVLGVLSLAEMGIGTALNYTLYKPMAENDIEKIKVLMAFYKKVYRMIASVVALLGIALIPFLKYLVNDPGNVGNIYVYYLIFLFNAVISYFVTYQFCLVNAEQKAYINSLFNTAFSVSTSIVQVISMLMFHSFMLYLLIGMASGIMQKVILYFYFKKRYPFLKDKVTEKLPEEELKGIKKNVGGLLWHKVGDVAIHQTDNIIVAALMNVYKVGVMDNYNLIINYLQTFVISLFSNVVPSLGNMVAVEEKKECFKIYRIYDFVDLWIYGFCSIALLCLFQPFISLWIGADKLIDEMSLFLICLNFYFGGRRVSFNNYKSVHGIFYDDKYVVIVSAIINLVLSVVCGMKMGLAGIYVGTVVAGLYQTIRRPMIAYERITGDKTIHYFTEYAKHFCIALIPALSLYLFSKVIFVELTILRFVCMVFVVVVFTNLWFWIVYGKTEEYIYIKNIMKTKMLRFIKKH